MKNDLQWKYPEAIIECDWLRKNIGNQKIRVYDCTTYLHYTDDHPLKPYDVESGLADYEKAHIPKSAFLDLQNDLSDKTSPYRFTLPNFYELAESFKRLGIGDPYHIILYSRNGMQWATRIWWMLYALGYENVSVLNGGYVEWERLCLPIESSPNRFDPANFKVGIRSNVFVGKDRVLDAIGDQATLLLNALTEDIHLGTNPRYGRLGRIPNSLNIPFHDLLEPSTGKFRPPERAIQTFAEKGITSELEIVNYCGGGIAASLDAFILRQLGFQRLQIYDNSMSEWAMDEELPIETG